MPPLAAKNHCHNHLTDGRISFHVEWLLRSLRQVPVMQSAAYCYAQQRCRDIAARKCRTAAGYLATQSLMGTSRVIVVRRNSTAWQDAVFRLFDSQGEPDLLLSA